MIKYDDSKYVKINSVKILYTFFHQVNEAIFREWSYFYKVLELSFMKITNIIHKSSEMNVHMKYKKGN